MRPFKSVLLTVLITSAMIVATGGNSVKATEQTDTEPSQSFAKRGVRCSSWHSGYPPCSLCYNCFNTQ